jgi:Domain of unknown function (DUF4388)
MLNNRFAVLTGHLNDYPLSDLIGVLRHQRKTGRLLIEYEKGPGIFYFNEGDLVDAQFGDLCGLQAICVSVGQPPAPFNFNSLVRPSRRSIENSLQRAVSELVGCWDENALLIDTVATEETVTHSLVSSSSSDGMIAAETKPLALPGAVAQRPAGTYSRTTLASVAIALLLLGLSAGIALTTEFGNTNASAPSHPSPSDSKSAQSVEGSRSEITAEATKVKTDVVGRRETTGSKSPAPGQPRPKANGLSEDKEKDATAEGSRVGLAATAADTQSTDPGNENASGAKSIKVVMQIVNGRVLKASVPRSQSGLESYEAMALRIARQRRYSGQRDGQETVTIRVSQP